MPRKSQVNYNDSGGVSNAAYVRAFHDFLRTNPSASEIQARYPDINAEFIRRVDEFSEHYRPALEELARR